RRNRGGLLTVPRAHRAGHADSAEYGGGKARLFAVQGPGDWAVLNRDDPECARLAPRLAARVVTVGTTPVATGGMLDGDVVVLRLPGAAEGRYPLTRTHLAGP